MPHTVTRRMYRGRQRSAIRDTLTDCNQIVADFYRDVNPICQDFGEWQTVQDVVDLMTAKLAATVQLTVR